ncbi:kinase-like domain-containing protein [Cladorrhinum sp. PSN259]|nr:kinase-like domain-containing protein [Cladorrhinum sp. PSN259]
MHEMSTTSPTPMGAGSHFTSLGRRTSARQALRRPTSRPGLSRAESNPVGSATSLSTTSSAQRGSHSQQQHYANLHDSSDDEMPKPMKLSALTKALLNDGHSEASSGSVAGPSERPISPPARPASRAMTRRSAMSASTLSVGDEREVEVRRQPSRQTRRGSVQRESERPSSPVRSRETSPAPRKRVVRLSSTTPGNGAFNSSFNGSFQQGVRRSLSGRSRESGVRERAEEKISQAQLSQPEDPAEELMPDINTPVLPVRTVRIAVGSSGGKGGSGSSSGVSSKRSTGYSDQEFPDDPATLGRPAVVAPPSSMRVKRVGKMAGSFLSGPARRGRRRQSEEDGEAQIGGDAFSSQEHDNQQPQYMDHAMEDQPASFSASNYPDYAASGSPVSSRDPSRVAMRRGGPVSVSPPGSREPEKSHLELSFNMPAPVPQVPAALNKENHEPVPPRQPKPVSASFLDDKDLNDLVKPIRPLVSEVRSNVPPPQVSPERKALVSKSSNTPLRNAPPPPPKMSVVETATAAAGSSAATQANKKRQVLLRVNGRIYTRIDCIGRGGSGKVYRVSAESGKMLALKRVSLESADENTVKGFKGEIDLLRRLHGVDRVIQLIDHELNLEKQLLSVLMEVGELDFNTLLKSRQSTPEGARLDPVFIRYYWKEMLECVQAVHARDVVHSDLKPANFVLVQGRLKLIDFGIANAIQTEMTVNVHRETQIGTPNYMSPESLMDSNQYAFTSAQNGKFCIPPPLQYQKGAPKLMKLGKPSDVWSLGCILYQMVYGLPPFGKIANQMSRCQAIINWAYQVEFPDTTEDGSRVPPSLIRTMRRCLNREQKERPTCDELLADTDPFLYPQEFDPGVYAAAEQGKVVPMTEELLSRIIQSVVQRCKERLPTDGEAVASWPSAYFTSIKKAVTGANGGGNHGR